MKRYQDDFKASIVKMHREEKRSIRSLSEEYGVSPAAIHNWVKGAKSVELEDGQGGFANLKDGVVTSTCPKTIE